MDRTGLLSFSFALGLLVVTLFAPGAMAQETRLWVGGESLWEGASNWSPPGIPGPDDTVILQNGVATVTSSTSIQDLTVSGGVLSVMDGVTLDTKNTVFTIGTINGGGTVMASESFLWTGGVFDGGGRFETGPGSHTEVADAPVVVHKWFQGTYELAIGGDGDWGGSGAVFAFPPNTLRVTGSLDIDFGGAIGLRLVVEAGGTVTKSGPSTTDFWGVDLEPGGMLRSTGGSLRFTQHAVLAGFGEITEGGEIVLFGSEEHTVDEGASFTGAGWLRMSTSSGVEVKGNASIEGIALTQGSLAIGDGVTLSSGHVWFSGGAIGGAGTVTASDSLLWTAGEFNGTGTFETLPGSHFEVSGSWKYLLGDYTVSIGGTGHLGGGNIVGAETATLRVTGSLDIEHVGDARVRLLVENGGTATKIGSTTSGFWGVDLEPGGMLRSIDGSLQFSDYGTLAGSGEITAGSQIVLLGGVGPNTIAEGTSITGAGWLRVNSGSAPIQVVGNASIEGISVTRGLLTIDDGVTLSGGHVNFSGGGIGGVGTVTASDSLLWTAGEFSGTGLFETLPGSHLEVSGSWKYMQDNHTLSVGGTGHLGGTGLGGNGGTVRVTGSLDIEYTGDTSARLLVEDGGTATKVGTVTTGIGELVVETGGTVAVEEGRLNGLSSTSLSGTLSVIDPGTFGVWGTVLFAPGSVVQGTGIIYNNTAGGTGIQNGTTVRPGLSPGELSFSGRWVSTADTRVEIEIGGTEHALDYDRLAILTTNVAQLAGTLDLQLVDGFLPARDDTFHVMTFHSRTGQFDQVTMPGLDPSDWFTVEYGATSVFLVATGGPNASPLAVRDSLSVDEDTSVQADLLDNDSDPNGDDLTLVSIGAAAHGETSLQEGKLLYVPDPDYFGGDTLSYRVTDGRDAFATGHVVITVLPVNDPPTAATLSLPTDAFSLLLAGDPTDTIAIEWVASTDVDGDELTYTWQAFPNAGNIGSECTPEVAPCLSAETTEANLVLTMNELAAATKLGLGESVVLHHAVGASDGEVTTWSAIRSLTVERGAITSAEGTAIPTTFALHAAYPNPFNPQTTITFDVPAPGHVRLAVYDMLGREVARLVDGEVEAGVHTRVLSAGGLASGPYFCVMTAEGYRKSGTLVLVK